MGLFSTSEEKEEKKRRQEEQAEAERLIAHKKNDLQNKITQLRIEKKQYIDQGQKILEAVQIEITRLNQNRAPKWEYITSSDLDSSNLDKHGELGWELIGITSYETGANGRMTVNMLGTFKRPVVPESEYPENIKKQIQPAAELLEMAKSISSQIEGLSSEHDSL